MMLLSLSPVELILFFDEVLVLLLTCPNYFCGLLELFSPG